MPDRCDQPAQIFDGQFPMGERQKQCVGRIRAPFTARGSGGLRSFYAEGEPIRLERDTPSTLSSVSHGNNFSQIRVFVSSHAGTLPGM
jgi:hypothetical protein